MPAVVVTDYTFPNLELEEGVLLPAGHSLQGGQCKTPESLIPLVAQADAVITQFAPVNAAVIAAMQRAKVIVRYGIGVDNVDLAAARDKGIPVCNVPDYCIDEVADHTLSFILSLTRQVIPNALHNRSGHWGLATPLDQLRTLRDQTVGIVGFGRIGREVAARLAPFKCQRLVFDPVVPAAAIEKAGCQPVTWEQLLTSVDILTLHCPSLPATKKMVNAESLSRMKRGALVVNLSRGDLIDTAALVAALQSGHIAGAALDVCDPEPLPAVHPLRSMKQVLLTPHIASSTEETRAAKEIQLIQNVKNVLTGEKLIDCVNQEAIQEFHFKKLKKI